MYIGQSATQYNNIRYVLSKLGVPLGASRIAPGAQGAHQHHFHITMAVPPRRDLPKNLLANTLAEEQSNMIDMTPEALPEVAQLWAQANVPGISQPANDWIGDNPVRRKNMESAVLGPNAAQDLQYRKVQYSDSGPLKIPTLKHERYVDYAPRPDGTGRQVPHEQLLSLASESCAILDMLAGKAGAWGPECKITQILQKPSGKLVPDTNPGARQGDFLYTPSRAGVHTARFILENGAGRKVDVTVKIRATLDLPEEGGSYTNPEESVLMAELGTSDLAAWQRSANLSALITSAQQTLTGFTDLPATALARIFHATPRYRPIGVEWGIPRA